MIGKSIRQINSTRVRGHYKPYRIFIRREADKMQVLYVLVSDERDNYYQQALISITSLRDLMPDIPIVLLVDDKTYNTLEEDRAELKHMCTAIRVVDCNSSMGNKEKSRFLKTSMRNLVDGDFLYVDTDTVFTNKVSFLDLKDIELGAVRDMHGYVEWLFDRRNDRRQFFKQKHFSSWIKPLTRDSFYSDFFLKDKYYNSGVMWVRDTLKTRNFFKRWHENWLYNSNTCGFVFDQPPLAKTNYEFNNFITELDGTWNCQAMTGVNFWHEAKICHFFVDYGTIHKLMNPNTYKGMPSQANKKEYINNIIRNAKKDFDEINMIITKDNLLLHSTATYWLISVLYRKCRYLFNIIERCSCLMFDMRPIFKTIFKKK